MKNGDVLSEHWIHAVEVEDAEYDKGACPHCGTPARLLTCWACCESAWVIECEHRSSPRPMMRGRGDGSEVHRVFCSECAETLIPVLRA